VRWWCRPLKNICWGRRSSSRTTDVEPSVNEIRAVKPFQSPHAEISGPADGSVRGAGHRFRPADFLSLGLRLNFLVLWFAQCRRILLQCAVSILIRRPVVHITTDPRTSSRSRSSAAGFTMLARIATLLWPITRSRFGQRPNGTSRRYFVEPAAQS
jgi:hypothetical protein